jgi:hypothetical protein
MPEGVMAGFLWLTVMGLLIAVVSWMSFRKPPSREPTITPLPSGDAYVDFDELPGLCRLGPGQGYVLFTLRQSGNEQQERRVFEDAQEALAAGIATLRRAQVPYAKVVQNTVDRFEISRPFHDHRGRAEGKKVGWIEIVRVPH